jgi:hypothetical protein
VLLYVVQASSPVHSSTYNGVANGRGALDHVEHTVIAVVDAFDYA